MNTIIVWRKKGKWEKYVTYSSESKVISVKSRKLISCCALVEFYLVYSLFKALSISFSTAFLDLSQVQLTSRLDRRQCRLIYRRKQSRPMWGSPLLLYSYSSIQAGSGLSLRGESLGSFEIPRESNLGYCNKDAMLYLLRGQQTQRLKYNVKYITASQQYIQRR